MRYSTPMFELGQIVATREVSETISGETIAGLIRKHVTGDFGIVDNEDIEANKQAIEHGERILSTYDTSNGRIYIITEWDRSYTTIMFVNEY